MTPHPSPIGTKRWLYRTLKLAMFLVLIVVLAGPADATPDQEGPPAPETAPTTAVPPPQGCPGGPEGPAIPGTECPNGSVPTPIPAGCPGSPLSGPPTAGGVCPDGSLLPAAVDPTPTDGADAQLNGLFGFDTGDGPSMSAYDIGCDEGTWNAFLRKMWCGAQALPYSFGKWMIGLTVALLDWMLAFQVAESLSPLAAALSNVYQTRLLGGLDVADLAWTLALFVGGWHLLRAKFSDGVREIATTFIIAVLGGIVLANPQGYLEGSITLARNASGTVLEAVDGALNDQPASDATAIRGQLAINLKQTFVAESYDLLNWNGPLTGECAVARDEILAGGPWGGDDRPREIMREHGCEAQAAFNEKPTDTRAFGSLAIGAVSGLVSALLIVLSVAVFVAQVTLIALFSGASVAWIVALFPGGRGILWWWLSRLVWAVLITFTSVFLLSWLAITLTVVLNATADVNLLQRSLIALVVVAAAFKFRSSVDRAIDGASARIAATMNSLTGPRGAAKPAAASATSGGGFQPMSWSPTQTALTAAAAGASIAGTAITVARTSAQRGRTVGSGAVRGGRRAGASALKGSKAIARAPVTIPQRIGQSRARTTQRAVDVRSRLDSARGRGQWARSARHPVAVAREAKEAAIKAQTDLSDWM